MLPRLVAVASVLVAAALASAAGLSALLPRDGVAARGIRVNGAEVPRGSRTHDVAEGAARAILDRRVSLRFDGEELLSATIVELGGTVDVDALAQTIAAVGRTGDLFDRVDDALEAQAGRIDVRVRVHVPVEDLAARIERFKDEHDTPPRPAKIDLASGAVTPHHAGRYVDPYAAIAAVDRALRPENAASADKPIDVPVFEIAPRASTNAVANIDVSEVVSRYETRFGFLGGQANRAQNVTRAASQMDGVVLMPGETVSFNDNVGPRSIENGFATAPEIYKGEMREGIGGGTCQVAGTLHAAAFFGGIEIVERSNHSRPSGYIPIGLDATVVYPVVDLRLRNPYDFPIVIHATVDKGTLRFELLGRDRPATVQLATEMVGVAPFKRKIEETAWLPAGEVRLKQKGIRGLSIRKRRTIHLRGGQEHVEVTTDVYPPTFEIYLVPPGTDVASALPPPPEPT
jgi:vancomycin resistance protein YoaR